MNDISKPRVTFLALCFNHEPYLLECLNAILAQTAGNFTVAELIVLDNASADASASLIQQWAAENIREGVSVRLLLETTRRGICANLNLMLAQATGDYLGLISTDDYWLPEKTARQVEQLERLGPSYALAYADALRIDEQGHPLEPASFIQAHSPMETLPQGEILLELLRGPYIPAMSTLVRRAALQEIGGFDETLVYEDYDTWLRLAARWQVAAIAEPLCAYRILAKSMIHTVAAQHQPAKLLSDARIMAKAAQNAALPAKTITNLHRRIVRLVTQLVALPGEHGASLTALSELVDLPEIHLLADQHEHHGPVSAAQSASLLAKAKPRATVPPLTKRRWWKFWEVSPRSLK